METRKKTPADVARALSQVREKRRFLAHIKLKRGCARCGYRHHSVALEFHHPPDTLKVGNMAYLTRRSWVVLKAEMAKCEVLCANCHRVISYKNQWPDGAPADGVEAPSHHPWEPW